MVSFELIFIILFTKHDAIYIADPSSMQDPCNINFVIDLDHRKDYVAKWLSIGARNPKVWGSIPHHFSLFQDRDKTKNIFL